MKEDMAGCLEAVRLQDYQMLDQQASLVRGRCVRLLHVVQCGMVDRNDQCTADQQENVNQAVVDLRNKGLSICLSNLFHRLMSLSSSIVKFFYNNRKGIY